MHHMAMIEWHLHGGGMHDYQIAIDRLRDKYGYYLDPITGLLKFIYDGSTVEPISS